MQLKLQKQLLPLLTVLALQSQAQNVGIGTNAPAASAKLEITSTNSGVLIPRVALTMTTAAGPVAAPANSLLVYNTATAADVTPGFYYWSSISSSWVRMAEGTGWLTTGNTGITAANFLGTINAADLIIRTNNTEKMRVESGGDVGIGVTNPASKLDISAAARSGTHATGMPLYVTGTLAPGSAGAVGVEFRHDNGTQGIGFGYNTIYATGSNATQDLGLASRSTGNLNFSTNAAQRMIILGSNGNVGINTTTPVAKLHTAGGGQILGTNGTSSNTRTLTILNDGQAQTNFGSYPGAWSPALQLQNNDNSRMVWLSALDGASGFNARITTLGSGFDVYPNNVYSTTFATNGFVGINTTAPAHRLDVIGAGASTVDLRTTGRIWTNSSSGGMWMSDLQDCFMGNISATQFGFWSSTVGWNAFNITKNNGYIGVGTTSPAARLNVVSDENNLPVIYGVNTNSSAGTTSFGVRGECGSTGLGSAGVSGVSTNSSQNEIGVVGDYSLWGTGVFGMGWAAAYSDMQSSRDFGVFGTVNYYTGTGVYGRNTNTTVGSAYGMYCNGNFAVTGAKSGSVPTSQGNQLIFSTESPEIWLEDLGYAQLQNGQVHVNLDDMFYETVFIDATHPMHTFLQEQGDCNGLYFIPDTDGKGFTVKEKNNGVSNIGFSYRIMAKRRFYQDQRFGVDANQPLEDNLSKAIYQEPSTTDPAVMKELVDKSIREKEAAAGSTRK